MRIALPEQVWVDYRVAGYGSRALAYGVDLLIRWTVVIGTMIALLYLYALLAPADQFFSKFIRSIFVDSDLDSSGTTVIAIIVAFIFVTEWSYPVFFEVRRQGVTPGKGLFGLRVVDEDGLPITFQASALRTLLLIVDLMPACGLVALLSMLFTKRSQRLGDLVAKTVVIYESDRKVQSPVPKPKTTEHTIILPIKHYRVLEQYLTRKDELRRDSAQQMAEELIEALKPLVAASAISAECPWEERDEALRWILQHAEPRKEVAMRRTQS